MKTTKLGALVLSAALVLLSVSCQNVKSETSDDQNSQTTDKSYRIRIKVVIKNNNIFLSKLVVILPLAQTNQYQDVRNVNANGGTAVDIPETDDKYYRWIYTANLPSPGGQNETSYDFEVTLHPYNFNFSQVKTIYPYNTSSSTYLWYTGPRGEYVVPNNPTIQSIGSTLWTQSTDIIDYAKRCYEYVAQNYRYLNPNTGLHTLADILAAGGGDCGNLSSIYISLLRFKGIPSRHIVTVRPDGSTHVWSDFYLETYGWIPVDVTSKNSNPSGDFFGKYDGNGIVFNKQVWMLFDRGGGDTYYYALLQSFHWWWWGYSGGTDISASYSLSSTSLN